jgi:lipoprotein signal peptidase
LDLTTKAGSRFLGIYQVNTGIGLGILAKSPNWVIAISTVILAIGFYKFKTFSERVILIGGLANLIDRLVFGAVTDWIMLPGVKIWFNLADVYINLGLALVVASILNSKHEPAN